MIQSCGEAVKTVTVEDIVDVRFGELLELYSIHIMNVYECNGANYVHELKDGMFYSTRRSRVEWNIPAFNE